MGNSAQVLFVSELDPAACVAVAALQWAALLLIGVVGSVWCVGQVQPPQIGGWPGWPGGGSGLASAHPSPPIGSARPSGRSHWLECAPSAGPAARPLMLSWLRQGELIPQSHPIRVYKAGPAIPAPNGCLQRCLVLAGSASQ